MTFILGDFFCAFISIGWTIIGFIGIYDTGLGVGVMRTGSGLLPGRLALGAVISTSGIKSVADGSVFNPEFTGSKP